MDSFEIAFSFCFLEVSGSNGKIGISKGWQEGKASREGWKETTENIDKKIRFRAPRPYIGGHFPENEEKISPWTKLSQYEEARSLLSPALEGPSIFLC